MVRYRNTSALVKSMIRPFINKYREPLIKARVTGQLEELTNTIGKENFEIFNDIINKVDYLTVQGLERKLENGEVEDAMITEYEKQKAKLEEVYRNMELYQANEEQSRKQREEETKKEVRREKSIKKLDEELTQLQGKEQEAKNLYEQYEQSLKGQFNKEL